MTWLLFALGILAGALASSLWHSRARIIGEFNCQVGGLRDFPVVSLIFEPVTYVLTQEEALKISGALSSVVAKQRAMQGTQAE